MSTAIERLRATLRPVVYQVWVEGMMGWRQVDECKDRATAVKNAVERCRVAWANWAIIEKYSDIVAAGKASRDLS